MGFLSDRELAEVQGSPTGKDPFALGLRNDGYKHKDSPIQACSLDLTVGEVFVPGAKSGDLGSAQCPLSERILDQGETVVLRSFETLAMPPNVGGIAFPPAHVSVQGLLMTNPGHVDPGYYGKMHFTVINMGRKPFHLRRGDKIVRLLLFKLAVDPLVPFNEREGRSSAKASTLITDELLERLSPDFLDVRERASVEARKAVRGIEALQKIGLPLAVAILSAAAAFAAATLTVGKQAEDKIETLADRTAKLEGRIGGLGGNVNLDDVEKRLKNLESKPIELSE